MFPEYFILDDLICFHWVGDRIIHLWEEKSFLVSLV